MKRYHTSEIKSAAEQLRAGDTILLSGTVYTARDAAHKRLALMIQNAEPLPFALEGGVIYYAGPTPEKPGMVIGSCGPTTSSRMDVYTPMLLDLGLGATIGKGNRSAEVTEAIIRNNRLFLCHLRRRGAGRRCITSLEVVAFPELGCESIKKLNFKDFPLITAIDGTGGSIFVKN